MMLDIFKRPVVMIIIVVAIIGAMVWSYISKAVSQRNTAAEQQTAQSQLADLTTVDPKDYDEVIKNELTTATTKAQTADPGNKLAAIDINLPSLELKSGDTRYIFTSATDALNNWTISFAESSGNFVRASIPKDDYFGPVQAMNTSLWKFNYVTALQIAEKNGGSTWRQNNGLSSVNITLKHGGKNNWLLWTVTYSSGDQKFVKIIDSNSGNTVEE